MSESSLNDSQIMKATTYSAPDAKGRRQLEFVLPSGRKIVSSDWLVPEEVKGKVLIAWANAIRAEDAYDIQERQEREVLARAEKRARESSLDALTSSAAPAATGQSPTQLTGSHKTGTSSAETSKDLSTTLPDDPADMIYAKLQSLRTERGLVADQLLQSRIRLDVIERNISRWETVLSGLGLPSQRAQHEDNKASSAEHRQGAPVDVDSNPDPAPVPPRRLPRAQRRNRAANKVQPRVRHNEGVPVQRPGGVKERLPGSRSDDSVGDSGGRLDARPEGFDGFGESVVPVPTGDGSNGTVVSKT